MPPVRRLTAILAADVAGYSRLMGVDEEGTHERLKAHLVELIDPKIGEYHGVVRVPRRVFQRLLPETPIPERCVEAYYLRRTGFESIAERKIRRRQ